MLTRATLQTLAERLTGGEAEDVAAQLPMQMKEWLLSHATPAAEKFGVDEFVRRVSDKANVTPEDARRGARAVFVTLRAAATARGVQRRDVSAAQGILRPGGGQLGARL